MSHSEARREGSVLIKSVLQMPLHHKTKSKEGTLTTNKLKPRLIPPTIKLPDPAATAHHKAVAIRKRYPVQPESAEPPKTVVSPKARSAELRFLQYSEYSEYFQHLKYPEYQDEPKYQPPLLNAGQPEVINESWLEWIFEQE